jgi:hypothetical protein
MVMPGDPAGSASMSGGAMLHMSTASAQTSQLWVSNAHVGMLLAHLAAGLFLALWLAAGERAAWTLLRLAARPVVETLRILLDTHAALAVATGGWTGNPVAPGWGFELVLRPAVCPLDCLSRRGPPRVGLA